jgi:DUF4097 and DUF4098 domain-containing protein YvlB
MMYTNAVEHRQIVQTVPVVDTPVPVTTPTPALAETERLEKTFPLTANGRICLSNINGSIKMIASDRNEVRIIAVKRAETREQLNDVEIRIDARPDYVSIESDYGDDRTWKGDKDQKWKNTDRVVVEYELTVPRGAVLNEIETVNGSVWLADFTNVSKVSTVNGMVKATNLKGTAELSTVNGELFADFDRLLPASKINLETVNGRVNLLIPSDSSATVKAESLNGAINNDFGLPNRRGKYVGNALHGRLGGGEVAINLESVNGPLNVKRRNDGRTLSPATNLLPAGDEDDDDGNVEAALSPAEKAKLDREIDRNIREAQRKAIADTQRELDRIKVQVPKIKEETLKDVDRSIDTKELKESIKLGLETKRTTMPGIRDAFFLANVPRVETKTNNVVIKGVPKVTVDAKACSVHIRGWDNPEIKYSVTKLRGGSAAPPSVTENKNDGSLTIRVSDASSSEEGNTFDNLPFTRIEVFVPRKSNLKIMSDEEIRIDGVSGELEIAGGDASVDVRNSGGKLRLKNVDGRARVIGFDGEVNAQTDSGQLYLEGSISKLTANAGSGTVIVTLPADVNADVSSSVEPETEGFTLSERGSNSWRLGNGGANYSFSSEDGRLVLRNSQTLSK